MIILFTFLFAILFVLIIVIIIDITTHKSVYGNLLSDELIEKYYKDDFILNDYCYNMLIDESRLSDPYFAKSHSTLTKWHIQGVGVIPRWSKYTKILDNHYEKLIKERDEK